MAFLKRSKDPFTQIQNCLQKRDYKAALVWFKPLLDKDTKNTQVRLRYADTLVLAGSKREAIKQYRIVADELAEAGFMIRAIAINKKIVQLDPTQTDVHEKLANMNEERSRATGARSRLPLQTAGPLADSGPEVEDLGMEEVVPPQEIGLPPPASEPKWSLDESMAMEFGGSLPTSKAPEATELPPVQEPALEEDVVEVDLGGVEEGLTGVSEEPESIGFELTVEEEPVFQETPAFEEPAGSLELESSGEELELAEDGEALGGLELPTETEAPSPDLEPMEEGPSFDEAPVSLSEDTVEPGGGLELTLEEEPELELEEELQLESEAAPELESEAGLLGDLELDQEDLAEEELEEPEPEADLDIETEPDMAADGKDPLVGLLGEDIESMIDSIIDDVGSSVSGTRAPAPKPATRIPLFSDLTAHEFVDVAIMLVRRSEKAGTVIVQEGDPGDSMFIVSTGEVVATREHDGETLQLATLRDGDFFGEMAVLSGEPRTATVTAVKNTELLVLSRSDLNTICSRHPHVEAKLRLAYDERSMRNP